MGRASEMGLCARARRGAGPLSRCDHRHLGSRFSGTGSKMDPRLPRNLPLAPTTCSCSEMIWEEISRTRIAKRF
jgi:hypothetical protein